MKNVDSHFEGKPSIVVAAPSWIGRIMQVDYIGRSVAVAMLPEEISGPSRVQVIPSIDLGTMAAPLVKPGQTIRIVRKQDNTYLGIQIDPPKSDSITRLSDLVDYVLAVLGTHKTHDIWWRGQTRGQDEQGTWTLVPSVYRESRTRKYEISSVSRFMAKARSRHLNCPPEDRFPDWMFLMQHYGLPTRLLDWTESPLIAAFFAVQDVLDAKDGIEPDGVIWALNPTKLNRLQIGEPVVVGAMSKEAIPLFHPAFDVRAQSHEQILAITTHEIDTRMLAQASTFTLHGFSKPLEELDDHETFLHKIIIPGAAKKTLRVELEILGIRLENLFPDLDHLAQSLKDREYW